MTVTLKSKVPTTSTVTATAGNASILASNGITNATLNWAATNTQFSNGGNPVMTLPQGENIVQIEKSATLDVKGRVRINGEYLDERLERIETLLQIPSRDVTMESKYPKLKELWEQYNRELAKYKTWETLKDNT